MSDVRRATCVVEGCPRPKAEGALCHTHRARKRRFGDALTLPRSLYRATMAEHWHHKGYEVDEAGCWIWQGSTNRNGYGGCSGGTDGPAPKMGAHVVSWIIHRGPVPPGLEVCHTCDVRACVNPEHLWLGTHRRNMRDAQEKGRVTFF